jgi:hypothetical protein
MTRSVMRTLETNMTPIVCRTVRPRDSREEPPVQAVMQRLCRVPLRSAGLSKRQAAKPHYDVNIERKRSYLAMEPNPKKAR